MDPGEVLWGLKQDLLPEFIIDALAFIQHISWYFLFLHSPSKVLKGTTPIYSPNVTSYLVKHFLGCSYIVQ